MFSLNEQRPVDAPAQNGESSDQARRKIQHHGQKKDETIPELDKVKCLCRIKDILVAVKEEYAAAEKVLLKISPT
jgi:hypothetical protein